MYQSIPAPKQSAILITLLVGWLVASTICVAHAQLVGARDNESFRLIHSSGLPHNARSCAECHAVPTAGGSSKVTVVRAGDRILGRYKALKESGTFHQRGESNSQVQAQMIGLRVAPTLLGDGYVEAIADWSLMSTAAAQDSQTHGVIHGTYSRVTVPGSQSHGKTIGRFGWKAQHATLLSASADALNNELGEPNAFFSSKQSLRVSPNDPGGANEINSLVEFLRSTEPIAPDAVLSKNQNAIAGSRIFDRVGCGICHRETLQTAPAGTVLAGGTAVVSERLGNREIHPYSDFLLHDVGTGDGIIQNIRPADYNENTANKFRTAPLWGVRYRSWLMHDGKSVTYHQAIMRHAGEASSVVRAYQDLPPLEKEQLRRFLDSL